MITYDTYSQKIFAEHSRRQHTLRRKAKHVRWTYPLFLVCFFVLPIVVVVQAMRLAYNYDLVRLSEIVPRELFVDAMPVVYMATGALSFFALLVGVLWGASKSRHYTFEAENLDLKTRQEYHLLCISKFLESVSQQTNTAQTGAPATQATTGSKEAATHGVSTASKPIKKHGASSAAHGTENDPLSQIVIHSEGSDNDHEIRI